MSTDRLKRVAEWLGTPSGVATVATAATAIWAAAGLPAARAAGVAAIVLATLLLTSKFSHLSAVSRRVQDQEKDHRRRAKQYTKVDERIRDLGSRADAERDALRGLRRGLESTRSGMKQQAARTLADQTKIIESLRKTNEQLRRTNERLDERLGQEHERLTATNEQLRARLDRVTAELAQVRRELTHAVDEAHHVATASQELAQRGLRLVRTEVGDLSRRLPRPARLDDVDAQTLSEPLLSIAIPGFNRPEKLDACLRSIIEQVSSSGAAGVEVWITDDCSPISEAAEVAHSYAVEHPFVGFRTNAENVGLERNLLRSCLPCRGRYLWIVGNDDLLNEGSLARVLADAEEGACDVLLYGKTRIDGTGDNVLPTSTGVVPPDVAPGESRVYESVLDVARTTGIISAFGFISTLVVRRTRFTSASAEPYFGLSMYPQLGLLLETCGTTPVLFRHESIVSHRTQNESEKLAESIGRREESFMSGGADRNARWFGAAYAALLQRAVDRSVLESTDFAQLPERLFGVDSMVDWIAENRRRHLDSGKRLSDDVEADAERFFRAVRP